MRILVVTSTFPRWPGDTEPAFVFELCRRLHMQGADVDVLAPHAADTRSIEQMDGINVYRYRYGPERLELLAYRGGILANLRRHWSRWLLVSPFLLLQAIAVRRRLNKEKYDLIHAHWIIPQGFICVLMNLLSRCKNRIPVICTAHGGDLYALCGWPFNSIKDFVMERLAHLCVVSRAMQETCIAGGVKSEKISVLPMGVDLKRTFIPVDVTVRRNNRLIFVGRFVEKKGTGHLLDAVAIMRNTITDIELLLVGDGPLLPAIRQKITQLGLEDHVMLAGSLSNTDLPPLYSSAAICVMPSVVDSSGDQEGLGLVMVEALGCGCAVVASDLPATHDVMQHGQTGMLVRPGDAVDLAEKIMHLLRDRELRIRLATNGREYVRNRFDWDETAAQYHKLIARLVM